MYVLWFRFISLFLRRRCVVTLKSGQRIVFLRPKHQELKAFKDELNSWSLPTRHRITLASKGVTTVVMSDDILTFTVR